MAVYYNLKGTTQPFFQIGKQGATIYPGAADPAITYTVIDGDIWLPPNRQVKVRSGGEWETILFDDIEITDSVISNIGSSNNLELHTDNYIRFKDYNDDMIADFYYGSPLGIDGWLTFQAALGGNAFIGVTNETPFSSDLGIRFLVQGTGTLNVDDGDTYASNISNSGDIVVKKYVDDEITGIFGGLDNDAILYLDNTGALSTSTNFTYDGTALDLSGELNVDNIRIDGNTISSTNTDGDILITPDGDGELILGNATAANTVISSPEEADLIIEAGSAAAAADGGDLYLRGGEATGTGVDGTVFFDRGGLVVGAPTGGTQGAGTINAVELYEDGESLASKYADATHTHPLTDIEDFGADGGFIRSNGTAWTRVAGVDWDDLTNLPGIVYQLGAQDVDGSKTFTVAQYFEANIEQTAGWFISSAGTRMGLGGVPNLSGSILQVYGSADIDGGSLNFRDGADVNNVLYTGGTETLILRNFGTEPSTLLEIRSKAGNPLSDLREATLALTRTDDSGNAEFLDLYNNGYHTGSPASVQHGLRIQKRGTGEYRPFVFDWYDGTTYTPGFTADFTDGFEFFDSVESTEFIEDGVALSETYAPIWNNTVTATSKTIVPWERCFVTASGQTITLPITPADDTEVTVSIVGTFIDTVIARNGEDIMGLAEDMTIDQPNTTVHLVYVNSTLGWRVI